MLCVRTDVGVKEQTVLLQPTGEASPWKQAERGHTVRGKRRRVNTGQWKVNNETMITVWLRLFYLYKCLCCAESSVLRMYLCGGK